jgi:hypothetical protein
MATEKVRKIIYFFPSSFRCCWIWDPEWKKLGSGINSPDPQHYQKGQMSIIKQQQNTNAILEQRFM